MKVIVEGTVFSGKGEGKRFVALPWVSGQIEEKMGFLPYPGTLNIKLSEQLQPLRVKLEAAEGFAIKPEVGFFTGKIFPAMIDQLKCAVVIPQVPDYPKNVLEIVAQENLREKLKIKDGSHLKVEVAV